MTRFLKSGVSNMSDMDVNYKIMESNYTDYEHEVNEEIYLLYDYLPVLYKDENEREYVLELSILVQS